MHNVPLLPPLVAPLTLDGPNLLASGCYAGESSGVLLLVISPLFYTPLWPVFSHLCTSLPLWLACASVKTSSSCSLCQFFDGRGCGECGHVPKRLLFWMCFVAGSRLVHSLFLSYSRYLLGSEKGMRDRTGYTSKHTKQFTQFPQYSWRARQCQIWSSFLCFGEDLNL